MTMTKMLTHPSAIKVQFLHPIFEDDFVERGMTAWFTKFEWDNKTECWKLYFDFNEFHDINLKYSTEVYYENKYTKELVDNGMKSKQYYTAIEANNYNPKYSVYYSAPNDSKNAEIMLASLSEYINEVM